MKNIIKVMVFVLISSLSFSVEASAQSFHRKGNVFEQVSTRKSSATATKTVYTWKDSKGNNYPIFVTKSGRCFVNKTSGKTGKEYKYYLDEEISKQVCKEMGITYVPKKSKK